MRAVAVTSLFLWAMLSAAQQPTSIDELVELIRRAPAYDGHPAQLRVRNVGDDAIEGLTIVFPNGVVEFGDVPAGAATEYEQLDGGVFTSAAYRFEADGERVIQPVIDWAGAVPLEGERFTYYIELVRLVRPSFPVVPGVPRVGISRVDVSED